MSVKLTCDLCLEEVNKLDEIAELAPKYQVAERIQHICVKKCLKRLNKQLHKLVAYYDAKAADDVRNYVLEEREKNAHKLEETA